MTVNYTTNLSLGQPVTGMESGTWGDDVNNAVTSYLDIAIAGSLALTSASFTANALTLANTQGTSSATNIGATTAQYYVLRLSSLAAAVTITAPSVSKTYLVVNADATYSATVKASGQSGVSVVAGEKAVVYFNGTDYIKVASSVLSNSTGTLPVANGGTGLTAGTSGGVPYYSSTSAITSSALLAANALMIGGGAGAAPATTTTGTGVVTALGSAANAAGGFTTIDGTATLTNKRITSRVLASTANSATPTLNTDSYDMMVITGQTVAITSFTTNLTGTPTNGQKLIISITGTGAIAITWGASFESSTVTLPSTTVTTARLDVGFIWNVATSKWRCVASA